MLKDAAAAQAVGWPPELHIAKTLARSAAETFLESKRTACLLTRLKIQYTGPEAEVWPVPQFWLQRLALARLLP